MTATSRKRRQILNMTSLSSLETLEPDALLNLVALFNASRDPKKINLSVGAYRDENGQSKVLDVVREVCSFFDSTLFVLKPLLEQTVLHNHVLIRICTHFTFAIMCIVFILFVCLFVVCLFCFVLFCARGSGGNRVCDCGETEQRVLADHWTRGVLRRVARVDVWRRVGQNARRTCNMQHAAVETTMPVR